MFEIKFIPEAIEDIRSLRKHERKRIIEEIEAQLKHQPTQETKNRKKLRPNQLAEWELRIGKFQVFYDVDEQKRAVKIEAVGYKEGNVLFLHGEEYKL